MANRLALDVGGGLRKLKVSYKFSMHTNFG